MKGCGLYAGPHTFLGTLMGSREEYTRIGQLYYLEGRDHLESCTFIGSSSCLSIRVAEWILQLKVSYLQ